MHRRLAVAVQGGRVSPPSQQLLHDPRMLGYHSQVKGRLRGRDSKSSQNQARYFILRFKQSLTTKDFFQHCCVQLHGQPFNATTAFTPLPFLEYVAVVSTQQGSIPGQRALRALPAPSGGSPGVSLASSTLQKLAHQATSEVVWQQLLTVCNIRD